MMPHTKETVRRRTRRAAARIHPYPRATVENFRQTLIRMRDLTCAELGGLVEMIPEDSLGVLATGGAAETPVPPAIQAQLAAAEAEQERLLAYLDALEAALERIAEGRYGRCLTCGKPIGEKRLEGVPCAERCAQCQARERGT